MFAYCGNNPVNYSDENGYFALPWRAIIKGLISGFSRASITAITSGSIEEIAVDFLIGFADGAFSEVTKYISAAIKVYDAMVTYIDFKQSGASDMEALSAVLLSVASDFLYEEFAIAGYDELIALTFEYGYSLIVGATEEGWRQNIEANQIVFTPSGTYSYSNNAGKPSSGSGGSSNICCIAFSS